MVERSQSKNIKLVVIYEWIQFCLNSSLHGWKYLVLPKTSKLERYVWLIICLGSLGTSIFLMTSAYLKFQYNPTVILTESTQHPIYKFVFPAVTICSFNKISKGGAYKMARKLKKKNLTNTDSYMDSLKLLFYLVDPDNYTIPPKDLENLQLVLNSSGKTEEEMLKKISPSCNDLLKKCMWKGEDKRCDLIFEEIKTPIGYCCSFNYFALKNKTVIRASLFAGRLPKKPRRTSSCGYQSALEVLIDNDPDNYFATHIPSVGFRVVVHNPYEFPDWAVPNILCEMNTYNFIGINPETITATKHIESLPVSKRKCLYSNERKLDNFIKYTFHNCMVECRAILTLEICGCMPFYLYNKAGSYGTSRICAVKDIPCIAKNEYLFFNISLINGVRREKCNCLADCETTSYFPESSKGTLDATYCTNQFSIFSDAKLQNHTIILIFFNDLLGTKHRRDVLFTWHTLTGYYGGILGLFTGFSFISLVEIIYFFVIKNLTDFNKKKPGNQFQNRIVTEFVPRKILRPI